MALDYLDFDYSEDFDGNGTWDAMAAVRPERLPALRAELAQLTMGRRAVPTDHRQRRHG